VGREPARPRARPGASRRAHRNLLLFPRRPPPGFGFKITDENWARATTLENRGIALFAVPEDGTSCVCARHGCGVTRGPRRLVKCEKGHVTHSDVSAALNILKRGTRLLGCEVKLPERAERSVSRQRPVKSSSGEGSNPAPKAG